MLNVISVSWNNVMILRMWWLLSCLLLWATGLHRTLLQCVCVTQQPTEPTLPVSAGMCLCCQCAETCTLRLYNTAFWFKGRNRGGSASSPQLMGDMCRNRQPQAQEDEVSWFPTAVWLLQYLIQGLLCSCWLVNSAQQTRTISEWADTFVPGGQEDFEVDAKISNLTHEKESIRRLEKCEVDHCLLFEIPCNMTPSAPARHSLHALIGREHYVMNAACGMKSSGKVHLLRQGNQKQHIQPLDATSNNMMMKAAFNQRRVGSCVPANRYHSILKPFQNM